MMKGIAAIAANAASVQNFFIERILIIMNRAFLLLTDREEGVLHGYLGIGPRNQEEASGVWNEILLNDMDIIRNLRQPPRA